MMNLPEVRPNRELLPPKHTFPQMKIPIFLFCLFFPSLSRTQHTKTAPARQLSSPPNVSTPFSPPPPSTRLGWFFFFPLPPFFYPGVSPEESLQGIKPDVALMRTLPFFSFLHLKDLKKYTILFPFLLPFFNARISCKNWMTFLRFYVLIYGSLFSRPPPFSQPSPLPLSHTGISHICSLPSTSPGTDPLPPPFSPKRISLEKHSGISPSRHAEPTNTLPRDFSPFPPYF